MDPQLEQYLRMKRMNRASSHRDHSELTAKLVAAFVTFGCVCFLALFAAPAKQPATKVSLAPVATPQPSFEPPPPPPPHVDYTKQFLAPPSRWASIDFNYQSYGPYKFSDGRKITLTLDHGEHEYDFGKNRRGWFSLENVYYFDVTGDGIPEAIVDVSHVDCGPSRDGGASCDGGAHLFFIYSINARGYVKKLFQFETGTYAYGCGFKSMTVRKREMSIELFGRCRRQAMNAVGPGRFLVQDTTLFSFRYSGKGFLQTELIIISTGMTDVRSYQPEIRIFPEQLNAFRR